MTTDTLQWIKLSDVHVHSFLDVYGKRRVTDNPKACDKCASKPRSFKYHALDGIYT